MKRAQAAKSFFTGRGHAGLLLLWLWLCLSTAPVAAQPLTMTEALQLAVRNSPSLAAVGLEPEAAAAALRQAGARPNPQLSLQTQLENLTLMESVGLELSQELELGGKRQARLAAAEANLEAAGLQMDDALRSLRLQVKLAFTELLYAQNLLQVREEGVRLADQTLELTRERLVLGDVAGLDVVQLEAELARRQAGVNEAQGQRGAAAAALSPVLGQNISDIQVAGNLAQDIALPPLEELQAKALERPDLQAAELAVRAREAAVRLEETRGVSNLTVGVGLGRERLFIEGEAVRPLGVIDNIDDRAWVLGLRVSMPLPINNTNRGNIEQAQVRTRAAQLEEQAFRLRVESEVAAAYQTLIAARAARRVLVETALPRAEQVLSVMEQAYGLGARGQLDVLNAREQYLATRLSMIEAARREELSLARLEAAVGAEFALPDLEMEPNP